MIGKTSTARDNTILPPFRKKLSGIAAHGIAFGCTIVPGFSGATGFSALPAGRLSEIVKCFQ
jgi:hypothetical protein